MVAARFSSDVLQTFYGPITEEENRNLPQAPAAEPRAPAAVPQALQPDVVEIDDVFILARSNFQEWLRVWKMDVSEANAKQ